MAIAHKKFYSPDVYVKHTGTKRGNGVYAARDYCKQEIVEICPVVVIDCTHELLAPPLKNIIFEWQVLAHRDAPAQAVALGFGSIYNHNNPANIQYRADDDNGLLIFTTVTSIQCDEEMTINYCSRGGGHISNSNGWFERRHITPIVSK